MRTVVGLLALAGWILYIGQVISVVNLALARRLGLQERPETVDGYFSHTELWAARWDVICLWIMPLAGVLMLLDHGWWPYAALIGGAVYVDTGGREAVKVIALTQQGTRTGSPDQQRMSMAVYSYFLVIGAMAIVAGLTEVA